MASERVVVVGAGGIFGAWIPHILREELDLVGIADLKLDAARRRVDEYELDCETGSDLEDLLARTRPDFVIDLTVPEAHCEVTCTALRAGCHVVGEKPMAASLAEGRRMVAASEETGKLYMVSQSRRWDSNHVTCARAVGDPQRGPLTTVNCDFYIGAHFGGFRAEMESPLILDMSIHHFDLVRMLTGRDPVAVYAHEFNPVGSWYRGDVAASCIFEMTDGVVFTYRGSWCTEGFQTSWNGDWQFICQHGGVRYVQDGVPVACQVVEGEGLVWSHEESPVDQVDVTPTGMGGALAEMLRFLRTGEKPQTECRDNIKSLAMVFGAIESARKRALIEIVA